MWVEKGTGPRGSRKTERETETNPSLISLTVSVDVKHHVDCLETKRGRGEMGQGENDSKKTKN